MAVELTKYDRVLPMHLPLTQSHGTHRAMPGIARPNQTVRPRDFRVAQVVRLAFYAFVATIPFETIDLGIQIEPTAITLGLLLLSLIFQPALVLRKPPAPFWLFIFYTLIFAIPVFVATPKIYFDEALWQLMVLVQLVVLGWVAFNILKSERAARMALLTLAASCTVLAILQQIGISGKIDAGGSERISALGFHPNNIARILGIGFLSLAGLTYAMSKSTFKSRLWVWSVLALIGFTIAQTGSRGGLLALAAGLMVFVFKKGAASIKIRNAAIVLIGIIFFTTLVFQSEMNRTRFESAIEDGKLARREQIYPTAWRMFLEKPLLGWGAKTSEYELGARLAHPDEESKNPHNLILFALVSTGLFGTIPLVIGLGLTLLTAWKARHGLRGVVPLSLFVMVLIANMSGVWLHNKLHWFVVAYVLSCPFVSRRMKELQRRMRFLFEQRTAIERGLLQ